MKTNIAPRGVSVRGMKLIERAKTSNEPSVDRMLLLVLAITQKEDGKAITRRTNLTSISKAEYESRFSSLKEFLTWYIENTKDEISLSTNSGVRVELKTKNKKQLLDSFIIQEACW